MLLLRACNDGYSHASMTDSLPLLLKVLQLPTSLILPLFLHFFASSNGNTITPFISQEAQCTEILLTRQGHTTGICATFRVYPALGDIPALARNSAAQTSPASQSYLPQTSELQVAEANAAAAAEAAAARASARLSATHGQ